MFVPMLKFVPPCVLSILLAAGAPAASVTVDQAIVIDGGSALSGSRITVVDGPSGPPKVDIRGGGSVAGFEGRDNSEIVLDGGMVTYLSSVENNARFVMKSGHLGCTDPDCQVSDYDALLTAEDSSTLQIFGGTIGGIIRLNDSSVAHFYGHDLTLVVFNEQFAAVEGTFATGEPILATFHYRPDIDMRVVLHQVPEPGTCTLLTFLGCLLWQIGPRKVPAFRCSCTSA